jgi:hypothetical protein
MAIVYKMQSTSPRPSALSFARGAEPSARKTQGAITVAISDLSAQRDGDNRLQSPSLVALAVASIRNGILAGHYLPGERLHEERLTRELDISRPPLR